MLAEIDESVLPYFNLLNRGRLIFPSNTLCEVFQVTYSIFNECVDNLEAHFLKLLDQKMCLIALNVRFWEDSGLFVHTFGSCPS